MRKRYTKQPIIIFVIGATTTTIVVLLLFLLLAENQKKQSESDLHNSTSTIRESSNYQWQRLLITLTDDNDDEIKTLPSLYPRRVRDYVGLLASIIGLLLAAGGGLGGGGFLVPIYILILQFPVKNAIPLSSVTVLGGAIANNILNYRKHHPDHPHRSCIDWELILQMEPMTIAGSFIGAEINKLLPDILLVILLFILLSFMAWKTLVKAHELHQQEDLKIHAESLHLLDNNDGNGYNSTDVTVADTFDSISTESGNKNLIRDESTVEEYQSHKLNWSAVKLTILFTVVTSINLIQGSISEGSNSSSSTINNKCNYEFVILVIIIIFSWLGRRSLLQKINNGDWIASDINWDEKNTISYPALAIIAGLVSGMFGNGGGIVKGPLMLALGVHPAVASATTACMILYTSSTATVSYAVFGFLKFEYALAYMMIGFISTIIGQTVMTSLLKKYHQRNSYIAYSIGLVVAISAICMSIESILFIIEK